MRNYKVKLPKKEINKINHLSISNVNVKDDDIDFFTNEEGISILTKELERIDYHNKLKVKYKLFIKKHLISIIGILLIFVLLINQFFTVQDIRFINYDTYDVKVENYLKTKLKRVGPFFYLNEKEIDINNEIKKKFYTYEWINIDKNGSFIDVYINKQNQKDIKQDDNSITGDLISTHDALIKSYYVKKGIVLIKDNQMVTKNQTLISGNLKIKINEIEYIRPIGTVIGEIVESKLVTVKKNEIIHQRTGKVKVIKGLSLFNKKIYKKFKDYKTYEVEKSNLFKLFFIMYDEIYYYETKNVSNSYNSDEAYEYSLSIINKDFSSNKIHDDEKIICIILINKYEDNDNYYFNYLVKKHQNIASFTPKN